MGYELLDKIKANAKSKNKTIILPNLMTIVFLKPQKF